MHGVVVGPRAACVLLTVTALDTRSETSYPPGIGKERESPIHEITPELSTRPREVCNVPVRDRKTEPPGKSMPIPNSRPYLRTGHLKFPGSLRQYFGRLRPCAGQLPWDWAAATFWIEAGQRAEHRPPAPQEWI